MEHLQFEMLLVPTAGRKAGCHFQSAAAVRKPLGLKSGGFLLARRERKRSHSSFSACQG